jgi:two-component system nitrate/nitrite response regulator NarL
VEARPPHRWEPRRYDCYGNGSRSTELTQLRVLVVSLDQLSRAGLAALLEQQPGIAVAGQITGDDGPDGNGLAQALEIYSPDVLVWDVAWQPSSAIENLGLLPEGAPPVLVLAASEAQASQARMAGANGVVSRGAGADVLLAALSAVAQGLLVSDPMISGDAGSPGFAASSPVELTPRELEVLLLLAEGLPNKGVAARLSVSEHTVKFHVNSIMGKLNAQSRTEAVTRATRLGLLPL